VFVPYINLIRPYKIIKESWEKLAGFIGDYEKMHNTGIIGAFWFFFIIGLLSNRFFRSYKDVENIEEIIGLNYFAIFSDSLLILIFIFIFLIMKNIQSLEDRAIQKTTLLPRPIE
jgi:hypothetical protein